MSPALQAGFDSEDPVAAIAPMADRIRQSTGADFVIVMDRAGRRVHQASDPSELGKATVGLDYGPALMEGRAFSPAGARGAHAGPGGRRAGVPARRRAGGHGVGGFSAGGRRPLDPQRRPAGGVAAAVGLGSAWWAPCCWPATPRRRCSAWSPADRGPAGVPHRHPAGGARGDRGRRRGGAADGDQRRGHAILGLPPDAVGRPMAEVLPSSRLTEILASGEAVFDQEMIVNDRVVVVNQMPLRYRGQPMGAVASFRDRTELQQLAGELNAVRRYSDALRAQAHEFRNRLHAVAGLIELGALDEALELIMRVQGQEQDLLDQLVAHHLRADDPGDHPRQVPPGGRAARAARAGPGEPAGAGAGRAGRGDAGDDPRQPAGQRDRGGGRPAGAGPLGPAVPERHGPRRRHRA